MNQVFLKTRELGEALLLSSEFQQMKEAEAVAMKNPEAALNMGRFIECRNRIQELLEQENADSEQLKALSEQMDAYQEKLQSLPDIAKLNEARESFSNLIEQVNSVLRFIVTGEMNDQSESEGDGCGGSCGSCGGCGHQHHLN
ncbi:YlbF family regulator [Bacillota bacterium Meth-B3]|nr:YlbF family regulator [Christensenellaceae bacterium]